MDNKLASLLTDENIPKPLRYLILAALICFMEWVLLSIGSLMPYVAGKIFLYALAALMLAVGVRLAVKLHRG